MVLRESCVVAYSMLHGFVSDYSGGEKWALTPSVLVILQKEI